MTAILGFVLGGVELIGTYVLWALETFGNLLLAFIAVTVGALFALLPSMSSAPSIGTPTWLAWLNWFFPVTQLLAILSAAVVVWVAFLAVRWALKLLRGL